MSTHHRHKSRRDPRRQPKTETQKMFRHIVAWPATIFFPLECRNANPSKEELKKLGLALLRRATDEDGDLDFGEIDGYVSVEPDVVDDLPLDIIGLVDTEESVKFYVLMLKESAHLAPTFHKYESEEQARGALYNHVKANYAVAFGEQLPANLSQDRCIQQYFSATDEDFAIDVVNPNTEDSEHLECIGCLSRRLEVVTTPLVLPAPDRVN